MSTLWAGHLSPILSVSCSKASQSRVSAPQSAVMGARSGSGWYACSGSTALLQQVTKFLLIPSPQIRSATLAPIAGAGQETESPSSGRDPDCALAPTLPLGGHNQLSPNSWSVHKHWCLWGEGGCWGDSGRQQSCPRQRPACTLLLLGVIKVAATRCLLPPFCAGRLFICKFLVCVGCL